MVYTVSLRLLRHSPLIENTFKDGVVKLRIYFEK